MKKKLIAILMAAVMVMGFAACGSGGGDETKETSAPKQEAESGETGGESEGESQSASGEVFKLGAFLPLSGSSAAPALEAQNTIEAFVEKVNAEGGINGAQIEFTVYDTQTSAEEAVKVVQRMLDEDFNAIVGSLNSGEILAAGQHLNNSETFTVCMGTSATYMQQDWEYIFRPATNATNAANYVVDMMKDLGYTKVAIINGQDDAALSAGDEFEASCEANGIEVVARESYDSGETDYSAQVTSILAAEPDAIYTSTIGQDGGPMVKQIRQRGWDGFIFNREAFQLYMIDIAGEEQSDFVAFPNPYVNYRELDDCDDEFVKEVLQLYYDYAGSMPETDCVYKAYDCMLTIQAAAEIAGSNDSTALKDAASQIKTQGCGGTLDFTAGDREGYPEGRSWIIKDGKYQLWTDWLDNGGYDTFLEETGRDK